MIDTRTQTKETNSWEKVIEKSPVSKSLKQSTKPLPQGHIPRSATLKQPKHPARFMWRKKVTYKKQKLQKNLVKFKKSISWVVTENSSILTTRSDARGACRFSRRWRRGRRHGSLRSLWGRVTRWKTIGLLLGRNTKIKKSLIAPRNPILKQNSLRIINSSNHVSRLSIWRISISMIFWLTLITRSRNRIKYLLWIIKEWN